MLGFCLHWGGFSVLFFLKGLIAIVILYSHLLGILAIYKAAWVSLRSFSISQVIFIRILTSIKFPRSYKHNWILYYSLKIY
jgi:hypothetical protein